MAPGELRSSQVGEPGRDTEAKGCGPRVLTKATGAEVKLPKGAVGKEQDRALGLHLRGKERWGAKEEAEQSEEGQLGSQDPTKAGVRRGRSEGQNCRRREAKG